jgi:uncharacterized protein
MNDEGFEKIKHGVTGHLRNLSPNLTYHTIEHTFDVLEQCERIAAAEGLTDPHELFLLRVAALYHDTGFLHQYTHHEEASCRVFLADAEWLDLSEEDKNDVLHLIMATQLPQQPSTLSERIICDADLDYLGRDDFAPNGDTLRREFLAYRIVASDLEWHERQLSFLKAHHYHTASSRKLREPMKQRNLQRCMELMPHTPDA